MKNHIFIVYGKSIQAILIDFFVSAIHCILSSELLHKNLKLEWIESQQCYFEMFYVKGEKGSKLH